MYESIGKMLETYRFQGSDFIPRSVFLGNGMGAGTAKDNNVQERICTETIGPVHRSASRLATCIQAFHYSVLPIRMRDYLKETLLAI